MLDDIFKLSSDFLKTLLKEHEKLSYDIITAVE